MSHWSCVGFAFLVFVFLFFLRLRAAVYYQDYLLLLLPELFCILFHGLVFVFVLVLVLSSYCILKVFANIWLWIAPLLFFTVSVVVNFYVFY